jgi:Protein of unknown function (DUF2608)
MNSLFITLTNVANHPHTVLNAKNGSEAFRSNDIKLAESKVEEFLHTFRPEDILVLFDVDETLTQPNHPAFFASNMQKFSNKSKEQSLQINSATKDLMLNIALVSYPWRMVDQRFPAFINHLKHKNIKSIAITASLTGKIGGVEKVEEWRFNRLKEFGIDFSYSFAQEQITLEEIPLYLGSHPAFYHGILCTNGENGSKFNKGHALAAFLQRVNYHPKAVLLIDDKYKNTREVYSALEKIDHKIKFIGIEYTKVLDLPGDEVTEAEFYAFWGKMAQMAKKLIR